MMNKVSITEITTDKETIRSIESSEPIPTLIKYLNYWKGGSDDKSESIKYRLLDDEEFILKGDEIFCNAEKGWEEVDFFGNDKADGNVGYYKKISNEKIQYRRKVK